MPKTICVRSAAVKVCQDELMTELTRRFPEDELAEALQAAYKACLKRFASTRHNRYKAQLLYRQMAERLSEVPDWLGLALGVTDAEDVDLPSVGVETVPEQLSLHTEVPISEDNPDQFEQSAAPLRLHGPFCNVTRYIGGRCNCGIQSKIDTAEQKKKIEAHLQTPEGKEMIKKLSNTCVCGPDGQPGAIPCPVHSEPLSPDDIDEVLSAIEGVDDATPEAPDSADEYASMTTIPTFEDFEGVFVKWPYVMETMHDGDRVLVLGYLSGRDPRNHDALVRRNCAYSYHETKDEPFKGLVSMVGVLKNKRAGNHMHLKVIPYRVGAKVRCWTNVQGEGDRVKYNRYLVLQDEGVISLPSRNDWDQFTFRSDGVPVQLKPVYVKVEP